MLSGVDVPHSDNTFKSQFLAKPEHIHIWIVRIMTPSDNVTQEKNLLFIKPLIFKTSHCATAMVCTFLETSYHANCGAQFEFEDI